MAQRSPVASVQGALPFSGNTSVIYHFQGRLKNVYVFFVYWFFSLPYKFRSQKGPTKPKNRTNSTKEFSERFKGRYRSLPSKTMQGFEANRTRKFTRTFGQIFVTKFLCGTFSVPKKMHININNLSGDCLGEGGCLRNSLMRPQIARNHLNPQIFPKTRRRPKSAGIPTEFILSAKLNSTEFP